MNYGSIVSNEMNLELIKAREYLKTIGEKSK
jgi:hypothetical protein